MRRIALGALWMALVLAAACGGTSSGDTSSADLPIQGDPGVDLQDATDRDPSPTDTDVPTDVATDVVVVDTFVPHPRPASIPMFDEATVVDFALTFAPDQWTQFQAYRTAKVKEYVHCSFTFAGETFADAACRSKSNVDYWQDEKKPQFVVRFNHWDKKGRFRTLRALTLEANAFHEAPIRDRIGMWMFRQVGLDASRVNHARLTVDGAPYGLYMNIETVDHEFLEAHFPDSSGNLFENGSELITNEETSDGSDLWDLEDRVEAEPLAGDHTAFYAAVAGIADMSQVLRMMAAEAAFPTGDNFTNGGTNYLWYDHPGRGFVVIPWDLDDVLSEWGAAESDPFAYWGEAELQLPPSKLRQLINLNPEWRAEYVGYLKTFRDEWLPRVATRVIEVCAQVRPYVEADPYPAASDIEDFDKDCKDAADRAERRRVFLLTALE